MATVTVVAFVTVCVTVTVVVGRGRNGEGHAANGIANVYVTIDLHGVGASRLTTKLDNIHWWDDNEIGLRLK